MNGRKLRSSDPAKMYRPVCKCGEAPVGDMYFGGKWVEAPWCPRCAPAHILVLPPKKWDRQRLTAA